MKKVRNIFLAIGIAIIMTSCYTYTFNVGDGAQTGVTITEKNHYVLYGLAALSTSDPQQMAGGSQNYTVIIEHTLIDGLLNALTGGLYTPTTTTVRR